MRLAYTIAFLCLSSLLASAQGKTDFLPGPKSAPPQSAVSPQPSSAPVCTKSYCKDMRTCGEAYHHFSACGMGSLDRDGDGIPCEDVCGKTLGAMQARIDAEPYSAGDTALGLMSAPQKVEFSCDGKRKCKQMLTCAEATFYLQQCGVSSLDGDRDGLPCNGLCKVVKAHTRVTYAWAGSVLQNSYDAFIDKGYSKAFQLSNLPHCLVSCGVGAYMALLDGLDGSSLGLVATVFGIGASVATVFGAGWKLGDKLGRAKADKTIDERNAAVLAAEDEARSLRLKLSEIEKLVSGDISYWTQPSDVNGYFRKISGIKPVLMIANFKGGVGKTTLAANLAAYFEKVAGKRVLLIDFDYQGSLSDTVLPHGLEQLEFSANLLIDPSADQSSIFHRSQSLKPALDFARVFPAFYGLNKVENRVMFRWLVQPDSPDVRYNLLNVLSRPEFQEAYDLVIIDAPPRLMTATVNAACASTHFLVPTILDSLSVSAALNTLGVFRDLKSTIAPAIQPLGFVPTMVATSKSFGTAERFALKELEDGRAEFWKQSPLPEIFSEAYICRKVAINRTAGQEIAYLKDDEVKSMFDRLGNQLVARLFHAGKGTESPSRSTSRAAVAMAS